MQLAEVDGALNTHGAAPQVHLHGPVHLAHGARWCAECAKGAAVVMAGRSTGWTSGFWLPQLWTVDLDLASERRKASKLRKARPRTAFEHSFLSNFAVKVTSKTVDSSTGGVEGHKNGVEFASW